MPVESIDQAANVMLTKKEVDLGDLAKIYHGNTPSPQLAATPKDYLYLGTDGIWCRETDDHWHLQRLTAKEKNDLLNGTRVIVGPVADPAMDGTLQYGLHERKAS